MVRNISSVLQIMKLGYGKFGELTQDHTEGGRSGVECGPLALEHTINSRYGACLPLRLRWT